MKKIALISFLLFCISVYLNACSESVGNTPATSQSPIASNGGSTVAPSINKVGEVPVIQGAKPVTLAHQDRLKLQKSESGAIFEFFISQNTTQSIKDYYTNQMPGLGWKVKEEPPSKLSGVPTFKVNFERKTFNEESANLVIYEILDDSNIQAFERETETFKSNLKVGDKVFYILYRVIIYPTPTANPFIYPSPLPAGTLPLYPNFRSIPIPDNIFKEFSFITPNFSVLRVDAFVTKDDLSKVKITLENELARNKWFNISDLLESLEMVNLYKSLETSGVFTLVHRKNLLKVVYFGFPHSIAIQSGIKNIGSDEHLVLILLGIR
jgi:hypothetical protein